MDISSGFRLGPYEVRPEENIISGPTAETRLEPKAMDVLVELARADGHTISRDQIVSAVWPRGFVSDDVLTRSISQIRKALGDNAKSPHYLLTVRKRGYKLTVPVAELNASAPDTSDPALAAKVGHRRNPARIPTFMIVGLLVIAFVFIVSLFQSGKPGLGDKTTVAVMPFEDLSDSQDQTWFATGMTEEIMNTLVKTPNLNVVGRPTVAAFKPAQQSLGEFAAKVGFTHVVQGSVWSGSGSVRVSVQLVRMTDGISIWSDIFDAELTDVVAIQDRISTAVIDELAGTATPGASSSSVSTPGQETDFSAYRLYLKGRYHLSLRTAENLEQAIHYFEYSLQIDSKNSRTHSALASVYAIAPYYSTVRSPAESTLLAQQHAELALRLDEENAEAHAVRGLLLMTLSRDWSAAAQAFERAMELAPGSAYIANLFGDFYYTIGDYDSALKMETKAARLDPLSAVNHLELGLVHTFRGEYQQAVLQADVAIELNDQLPNAWWQRFRSNFLAGNLSAARQIVAENASQLGQVYLTEARLMLAKFDGDSAKARRILSVVSTAPDEVVASLTKRALWYALAGDEESSANAIERAYASGDPILISPMHFFLPEDWKHLPAVEAALDKPGLRQLFELRRGFIERGSGRRSGKGTDHGWRKGTDHGLF